ncbi:MAG TPA: MipA/OmpV family protein [Kiritimatiellia bacterium]|nr:MipA/OmpV family protein [Kiritimatiellia bacterium]HMO97515.1 MipA/OmpV family protein [Kiritimatiellia bacterium]HMP97142.1 MipA/OmpV family protein [Kiritimatiellia bacterium]
MKLISTISALRVVVAIMVVGLLNVTPANGQEQQPGALVPLPSILDFTRGEGWGIALGVGVEYEAAYDGSDEYEFGLDPAGAIQWRTGNHLLFWEGMELGWRGRLADVWLVQAGARYEYGLEPDDSDDGALDGIEERDAHIVGFLEARRSIGDDWRSWIGGRVMGGESGFGWLGVIAAGHRFGDQRDGTGTEIFAFSTFGTDTFINKDFGVSAADAASSGLAQTDLSGGYRSTGANLIHRLYLTDHIHVIAAAEVEFYNSDIGDSPIARDDYEYGVELSVLWHF